MDQAPTTLLPITGRRDGHHKQVVAHAVVLDDDFTRDVLVKRLWSLNGEGYPQTSTLLPSGKYAPRTLHRFVFEYYKGPVPAGLEVDHADWDKLNALPSNLRAFSRSENMANTPKRKDNTSGWKGVSWSKLANKWQSHMRFQGKKFYLGLFDMPEEAARAVNNAYRIRFPLAAIPNPEAESLPKAERETADVFG